MPTATRVRPIPGKPGYANPRATAKRTIWLHNARDLQLPELAFQAPPGRSQYTEPRAVWFRSGRGTGKTRTCAEWCVDQARTFPNTRWHYVAPTQADLRVTSFEGESGLLACLDPSELKGGGWETGYNKTEHVITLTNGSTIMGFSAEKPSRLRGPQCHGMVLEEISSWVNAKEAYDMAELGCRLPIPDTPAREARGVPGDADYEPASPAIKHPTRFLVSSTPKRNAITRSLTKDPDVYIITESTYANAENLDPGFLKRMLRKYEGTTLGLQELHGVVLDDADGALFKTPTFRTLRITARANGDRRNAVHNLGKRYSPLREAIDDPTSPLHDMLTTRVGWDPAVTSVKGRSDLHGIIACGKISESGAFAANPQGITYDEATYDPLLIAQATQRAAAGDSEALTFILNLRTRPQAGDIVVLADRSGVLSPVAAAIRCIRLAADVGAAEVVIEQNQGYDTWKSVWNEATSYIQATEPDFPIPRLHAISANANKEVRATPLATAYEQAHNLGDMAPIRIFHLELTAPQQPSTLREEDTTAEAAALRTTNRSLHNPTPDTHEDFSLPVPRTQASTSPMRENEDEVSDGELDTLEFLQDEMTSWVPAESPKSPNRIDALVHCAARLGIGIKPKTAVTRAGRLSELI